MKSVEALWAHIARCEQGLKRIRLPGPESIYVAEEIERGRKALVEEDTVGMERAVKALSTAFLE